MVSAARSSNEEKFSGLLAQAQQGDSKAYAQMLKAVAELASRYIRRKTGSVADYDDIVQEILISVHKALPTYNPERSAMPWLGAIMHYRLNDWLRKQYSQHKQQHVTLEDVQDFLADTVTSEPLAYEYVNKAVEALPVNQKAVIQSMYHQDLSVAETAGKLGMSISAVKVTAHRAYKKLRGSLEDE